MNEFIKHATNCKITVSGLGKFKHSFLFKADDMFWISDQNSEILKPLTFKIKSGGIVDDEETKAYHCWPYPSVGIVFKYYELRTKGRYWFRNAWGSLGCDNFLPICSCPLKWANIVVIQYRVHQYMDNIYWHIYDTVYTHWKINSNSFIASWTQSVVCALQ